MKVLPRLRRSVLLLLMPAAMLVLPWQDGAALEPGQQAPFAAAERRGALVVGMPYATAPAAAGARIRTPERLDEAAAQALADKLGLPLQIRRVGAMEAARELAEGRVDVVLADLPLPALADGQKPAYAQVPTAYAGRPKAVMRSDTPVRRWQDLAGRSVCTSTAAPRAAALAAKYGAVVQTYASPSDALVAVRTGECDAGLIDDAMWEPLMKLPEWKKFSASLPVQGDASGRVWLLPQSDSVSAQWLRKEMRRWDRTGAWRQLSVKWARDVAFDVYLDQEVPDCHG